MILTELPATSLQYVGVPVTAKKSGLLQNPTTDPVVMAFMPSGKDPASADWQAATWMTDATGTLPVYYAICLVGPGGTIALGVGTYDVWVKVTDNPEIVVLKSPVPVEVI